MKECSVEDCEKPVVARGWCRTHYMRWKRNGDLVLRHEPGRVCSIEGCGRPHQGRGWCWMHYMRWRTHGDPIHEALPSQWKGDGVGYQGWHVRLQNARGVARDQSCVDCGESAAHWTLKKDHAGDLKTDGRGRLWTLEEDDYEPRCIPCHRAYDRLWGGRKGRPPTTLKG